MGIAWKVISVQCFLGRGGNGADCVVNKKL